MCSDFVTVRERIQRRVEMFFTKVKVHTQRLNLGFPEEIIPVGLGVAFDRKSSRCTKAVRGKESQA